MVVAVDQTNIGSRVSIRYLLRGQHPSDPDVLMTDVVGHLLAWGPGTATVRRRNGELVDVPIAAIVAAKVVPPIPPRPAATAL